MTLDQVVIAGLPEPVEGLELSLGLKWTSSRIHNPFATELPIRIKARAVWSAATHRDAGGNLEIVSGSDQPSSSQVRMELLGLSQSEIMLFFRQLGLEAYLASGFEISSPIPRKCLELALLNLDATCETLEDVEIIRMTVLPVLDFLCDV